ncbi:MAG: endonuclease domain-containing protein [Candidatus Viridilinea halotolerans]|uniref:Endonuclease domain-containing protein n=1 Tax=Candidatus Viridilinea halotolerans TaxID=2491704 RepID=A0A426TTE9_9CHLR|nr:MAG: endonuclease domain-containing protein [Candidatus Viridilinea halotolerans]
MTRFSRHRWRTAAIKQARARELRQAPTAAETLVWEALRHRRLDGWKFRRQHPIGHFIVDFCCIEQRVVVEVDGGIHHDDDQIAYDHARTAALHTAGYRVIRLMNDQIDNDAETVWQMLRAALA